MRRRREPAGGDEVQPTHIQVPATERNLTEGQDTLVGRTLGDYRIERLVSRGGMGELYEAYDAALDKRFALKVIRGWDAARPDLRERFVREARLAARVEHPNLVPILKLGRVGNLDYCVMPFVAGVDLERMVADRDRGLPPRKAVSIVVQAARGLAALHAAGIVHRDVKPSNLLAGEDGRIRVTDFGLAFETDQRGALTASGALLGTPEYMSPEQARGEPVDARTDVYSLGLTLFFLLTGRRPFAAGSVLDVLNAQVHTPLSLPAGIRGAPLEILMHMTSKEPARRPGSMEEVVERLEAWSRAGGSTSTASAPRRKRSPGLLVAGLAAAAVLGLGPLALWAGGVFDRSGPGPEPRPVEPVARPGDPSPADPPVASPDPARDEAAARTAAALAEVLPGRVKVLPDARFELEIDLADPHPRLLESFADDGLEVLRERDHVLLRSAAGLEDDLAWIDLGEWARPVEILVQFRARSGGSDVPWVALDYLSREDPLGDPERGFVAVVLGDELVLRRNDLDGTTTESNRTMRSPDWEDSWTSIRVRVSEAGEHRISVAEEDPLVLIDPTYDSGEVTFQWSSIPELRLRRVVVRGRPGPETLRRLER